ncbi:6236_t:CDS:1, partial [Racocetra fulgida]
STFSSAETVLTSSHNCYLKEEKELVVAGYPQIDDGPIVDNFQMEQ